MHIGGRYAVTVTYVERLAVPASYWLITAAFGATFIVAIGGYFATFWFALIALVATVAMSLALAVYGRAVIRVGEDGIRVGRNLLEWRFVGGVSALDTARWRRRLGPEADARAFLCVRPFLHQGVEIVVDDKADPHPYWLVGSRHPQQLADAIGVRLADRPDGDA